MIYLTHFAAKQFDSTLFNRHISELNMKNGDKNKRTSLHVGFQVVLVSDV